MSTVDSMTEKTYHVKSSSDPNLEHEVVWDGTNWHCDCKGFQFRGLCRHIDSVSMRLGPLPLLRAIGQAENESIDAPQPEPPRVRSLEPVCGDCHFRVDPGSITCSFCIQYVRGEVGHDKRGDTDHGSR